MKVGHHGSRTSTSSEYLEAIDPEIAVICVGEGNRYDHPHEETLEKLSHEDVTVYRTDIHGTIEITTDGEDYHVRTERPSLPPPPTPEPEPPPEPEPEPEPIPEPDPEPKPDQESKRQITGFDTYSIIAGIVTALGLITIISKRI
jgi:competence protein ComEC